MCMGSETCPMLLMRVCPKSVFQFVLKCQELISHWWRGLCQCKREKNNYFVFFKQ